MVDGARPEMVNDVPLPVYTVVDGELVIVQVPTEGNPFKVTLPVGGTHKGFVIVPIRGEVGFGLTVAVPVAVAEQPLESVTVTK